jgi:hypothetical protein
MKKGEVERVRFPSVPGRTQAGERPAIIVHNEPSFLIRQSQFLRCQGATGDSRHVAVSDGAVTHQGKCAGSCWALAPQGEVQKGTRSKS